MGWDTADVLGADAPVLAAAPPVNVGFAAPPKEKDVEDCGVPDVGCALPNRLPGFPVAGVCDAFPNSDVGGGVDAFPPKSVEPLLELVCGLLVALPKRPGPPALAAPNRGLAGSLPLVLLKLNAIVKVRAVLSTALLAIGVEVDVVARLFTWE